MRWRGAAISYYCSPGALTGTDQTFLYQAEGMLEEKTNTSLLCPKGRCLGTSERGACTQSEKTKQKQCGVGTELGLLGDVLGEQSQ